ncbi:MAG: TolC family protein [Spirochaetales bacterium]|nr:TolC family protein [Spirochaetales bacterium]
MKRFFLLISIIFSFSFVHAETVSLDFWDAQVLAMQNSEDLDLVNLGLIIAQKRLSLQNRVYFPYLTISYNNNNSVITQGEDSVQHQLDFSINQMLFDGGITKTQLDISKIELSLQQQAIARKQIELMDTVWNVYQNILILQEKIKIQKENYTLAQDQLVIVRKRLELGAIREIDLIEAELEVTSMYQGIVETEFQLEDAWHDFKQLIAVPAEAEVVLTEKIDKDYNGRILKYNSEELYKIALKNSQDLQTLDFQVYQKQKEYEYAAKTYIPVINGVFTFSFSGDAFPLGSPSFNASLEIKFRDPLFPFQTSFGASKSGRSTGLNGAASTSVAQDLSLPISKQEIKAGLRSLELQKDVYKKNIQAQIDRAARTYNNLLTKILISRKSLKLQYKKLVIFEKQFELGEIISLELFETRNELVEAEISLLEQILQIIQIERGIERMVGLSPGAFLYLSDPAEKPGTPEVAVKTETPLPVEPSEPDGTDDISGPAEPVSEPEENPDE